MTSSMSSPGLVAVRAMVTSGRGRPRSARALIRRVLIRRVQVEAGRDAARRGKHVQPADGVGRTGKQFEHAGPRPPHKAEVVVGPSVIGGRELAGEARYPAGDGEARPGRALQVGQDGHVAVRRGARDHPAHRDDPPRHGTCRQGPRGPGGGKRRARRRWRLDRQRPVSRLAASDGGWDGRGCRAASAKSASARICQAVPASMAPTRRIAPARPAAASVHARSGQGDPGLLTSAGAARTPPAAAGRSRPARGSCPQRPPAAGDRRRAHDVPARPGAAAGLGRTPPLLRRKERRLTAGPWEPCTLLLSCAPSALA